MEESDLEILGERGNVCCKIHTTPDWYVASKQKGATVANTITADHGQNFVGFVGGKEFVSREGF